VQKWEYLHVYIESDNFLVIDSRGQYLKDEDYKAIDPKGNRTESKMWGAGMANTKFLVVLLNKLGSEGWEAVGNVNAGHYSDVYLLLKRPAD